MQSHRQTARPTLPRSSSPPSPHAQGRSQHPRGETTSALDGLGLIDRARALCAAADDVQRATIEATRRIAAIHGSPEKPKKVKAAARKPKKEPPDVCARPPRDTPPPRGEGWRRLGPVSVVFGSSRISAQPQTRRALARDVEVFVGGGRYFVVPADLDPGGGFCVSLNRDFEGETNMACMLYLRKKKGASGPGGRGNPGEERRDVLPPSNAQVRSLPSWAAAPAPFGSVGEAVGPKPGAKIPRHFSTVIEHELDVFAMSRPEDRAGSGESATVLEAQRRARQRALSQRKRETAAAKKTVTDLKSTRKPPTAAEVGKFKASRQAALARVASLKQKEGAQKREAERKAEKERQETKAESAARATALRAVTSTRVKKAATVNRQREREAELIRRDEERAKRERIAAVLAYDEAKADERERQVRSETYHRIRREERRRELSLQRQEEERMERMRLHEAGERYVDPPVAPAVQLARSFFSVAGSTSVSEPIDINIGATTSSSTSSINRAPGGAVATSNTTTNKTSLRHQLFEEERIGRADNAARERGVHATRYHQQEPHEHEPGPRSRRRAAAAAATRSVDGEAPSPPSTTTYFASRPPDEGGCPEEQGRGGENEWDGNGKNRAFRGGARVPILPSPTPTSSSAEAGGASVSGASVGSGGSGSKPNRKRTHATPVWKRAAVPLSKPYVPVPRKSDGLFAAS